MEKVRIRDLAKELGMETSKEILAFLERIGAKGKSASSNLEGDLIERVKAHFKKPAPPPPPPRTTTVTRADGVLERRSQKVFLRRGAPAPPPGSPGGGGTRGSPVPGGTGRDETRCGNRGGLPRDAVRPGPRPPRRDRGGGGS